MEYFAYSSTNKDVVYSSEPESKIRTSFGTILSEEPPLDRSDSIERITVIAFSAIQKDPSSKVFITDVDNKVLSIIYDEEYRAGKSPKYDLTCIIGSLLYFCILSFLITVFFDIGFMGFLFFLLVAAGYLFSVYATSHNELESAIIITMIFILLLLLFSSVLRAREIVQIIHDKKQVSHHDPIILGFDDSQDTDVQSFDFLCEFGRL